MYKEVLRTKIVKNSILFSGLRLFQKDGWYRTKSCRELNELSHHLQNIMQTYIITDKLIVGVPLDSCEVVLMELQLPKSSKFYFQVIKVTKTDKEHIVKIKRIMLR